MCGSSAPAKGNLVRNAGPKPGIAPKQGAVGGYGAVVRERFGSLGQDGPGGCALKDSPQSVRAVAVAALAPDVAGDEGAGPVGVRVKT
jgi:hypothetical protein